MPKKPKVDDRPVEAEVDDDKVVIVSPEDATPKALTPEAAMISGQRLLEQGSRAYTNRTLKKG